MCVSAVQTSQGIYSGFASNVDVPIVVLIAFGGSGSKVTCLCAKNGFHQKHMQPMVNRTNSHVILKSLQAQPDGGCPSK